MTEAEGFLYVRSFRSLIGIAVRMSCLDLCKALPGRQGATMKRFAVSIFAKRFMVAPCLPGSVEAIDDRWPPRQGLPREELSYGATGGRRSPERYCEGL